ncbi:MAG: leucine--tRNA ligase [Defluviitaleaceae bacterium]|nr:leucine--tRNA ligase [Defluviitaleaceae bacterium]
MNYNFTDIEKKWQERWLANGTFNAEDFSKKPKYYVLTEFFGPSGKGIHLGHVKAFTPSEVIARYKRLKGFNVLYPVGWDAFGLPTENYALKMDINPKSATQDSIKIFTNQLTRLGFSFDWSREFSTTDPSYYKWTQWIFVQLFKHGLAYKAEGEVNFCASCQTVLSNEDSQGGICDRCKNTVEVRRRSVWYLKMKSYSEKMLQAINEIDLKDNLKDSQRNWVGKSEGAEIIFELASKGGKDKTEKLKDKLEVFTTRPDTLYGVTYMAIAPEHPLIKKYAKKIANLDKVIAYAKEAAAKDNIERSADKQKTGVVLDGIMAINPATQKQIPVFVADYIMMGYGTGAIMAVPGHDTRDWEFAKKFNLPIVEVIRGGNVELEAYTGDGELVNSDIINGLDVETAKAKIIKHLATKKLATAKTNYKMQDWPFNRQRYWGEPFPIVICEKCGFVPCSDKDLPLELPKIKDFTPDASGNGPLVKALEWIETHCPKCGIKAVRESDTMPNWAGSSWYWLRFLDPHNQNEFVSQEKLKYWGAVDLYTGGTEHVTRHMLYASFWHNFLYDIKAVPHKLPFIRRMCNGLILDESGKKMGKSSGNAIDPIEVINTYGADCFRLHILFMGDYEFNTIWTLEGINGCSNFLKKVWSLLDIVKKDDNSISSTHEKALHQMIKRADTGIIADSNVATEDRADFKFNTVIAGFMEFMNVVKKSGYITKEELRQYLIVMNPFIPHITSEIYESVFSKDIANENFPKFDESKLVESTIEIPVQLLGKLKGTISIEVGEASDSIEKKALAHLGLATAKKVIYVPNKIVNVIV